MQESSIWILIANERTAAIYASRNGAYQLLRTASFPAPMDETSTEVIATPRRIDLRTKREFAMDIRAEMRMSAPEFDNIVIVADRELIDELEPLNIPAASRLLIAEIAPSLSRETAPSEADLCVMSAFKHIRRAVK